MQKKKAIIRIFGKVQGVFFRRKAKEQADKLGIVGWAKNESDGSVRIIAEGERNKIEELVRWSRQGSSSAKVDRVNIKYIKPKKEYRDFSIQI